MVAISTIALSNIGVAALADEVVVGNQTNRLVVLSVMAAVLLLEKIPAQQKAPKEQAIALLLIQEQLLVLIPVAPQNRVMAAVLS